ncbi:MAG: D-alanyl-D-alanine carboxypeptidase [Clostridia bacterium]|nr:D-alanyl-D-alanine carboxypeptidase [Clostridia bacterium]
MKKLLCTLVLFGFLTGISHGISAQSYVVYDILKDEIIASHNENDHRLFASTTKIMTALVALELYDADEIVTIKREWTGIEGSSIYLVPDEKISVRALLYGLLLDSGNDAAVALASLYTGNQADFISLMNAKAIEIGAESTFFENPSGLDGKNHLTTARDLALITAEAMKNETFREIVATTAITIEGRYFSNHNKLLKSDDTIIGVKTGYTKRAGRCLVTCAERFGRQYIAVTLSAPDDWDDHLALYDEYGKETNLTQVVDENDGITVPVMGERAVKVKTIPQKSINIPVKEGENLEVKVFAPRFIYNTAVKGEKYGEIHVFLDDKLVDKTELIFTQTVENTPKQRNLFNIWKILKSFRK